MSDKFPDKNWLTNLYESYDGDQKCPTSLESSDPLTVKPILISEDKVKKIQLASQNPEFIATIIAIANAPSQDIVADNVQKLETFEQPIPQTTTHPITEQTPKTSLLDDDEFIRQFYAIGKSNERGLANNTAGNSTVSTTYEHIRDEVIDNLPEKSTFDDRDPNRFVKDAYIYAGILSDILNEIGFVPKNHIYFQSDNTGQSYSVADGWLLPGAIEWERNSTSKQHFLLSTDGRLLLLRLFPGRNTTSTIIVGDFNDGDDTQFCVDYKDLCGSPSIDKRRYFSVSDAGYFYGALENFTEKISHLNLDISNSNIRNEIQERDRVRHVAKHLAEIAKLEESFNLEERINGIYSAGLYIVNALEKKNIKPTTELYLADEAKPLFRGWFLGRIITKNYQGGSSPWPAGVLLTHDGVAVAVAYMTEEAKRVDINKYVEWQGFSHGPESDKKNFAFYADLGKNNKFLGGNIKTTVQLFENLEEHLKAFYLKHF